MLAGTWVRRRTLLEYVKRRPGYQFAYITFNRSVMEEASTKFPKLNVKCLNFHKMAYAKFGFLTEAKSFSEARCDSTTSRRPSGSTTAGR